MTGAARGFERDRGPLEHAKAVFDAPAWLARKGVAVKRSGATTLIRCPMPDHDDRNPSCSLKRYPEGWAFKCFSCDASGDAVDLVKFVAGVRDREAIAEVHSAAGVAEAEIARPPRAERGGARRMTTGSRRHGRASTADPPGPMPVRSDRRWLSGGPTIARPVPAMGIAGTPAAVRPDAAAERGRFVDEALHTLPEWPRPAPEPQPLLPQHEPDPEPSAPGYTEDLGKRLEGIDDDTAADLLRQSEASRHDCDEGALLVHRWIMQRGWSEDVYEHAGLHAAWRSYGGARLLVARHLFFGTGDRLIGWADRVQRRDFDRSGGKRWLANAGKSPNLVGLRNEAEQRVLLVAEGVSDWVTLMQAAPAGALALGILGAMRARASFDAFLAAFRGRAVVIFPDKDGAGAKMGAKLGTLCSEAGMPVIYASPTRGDLSDALMSWGRSTTPDAARGAMDSTVRRLCSSVLDGGAFPRYEDV